MPETTGNARNKDEVILGPHAEWEKDKKKIPVRLTVNPDDGPYVHQQEQKVKKEKSDYVAKGFDLTQNQWIECYEYSKCAPSANWIKIPAQLKYSDKSIEAVIVEICCK